jgi:hypothetical protein
VIRYALQCDAAHGFEAWFGSSSDYDDQSARGLVECPYCGSHGVTKQIMAPAVAGTKRETPSPEAAAKMRSMMTDMAHKVRTHVEQNFDYVGDTFAREARAIHEGTTEKREIYGEATPAEVRALRADGVAVAPLPPPPVDPAKVN